MSDKITEVREHILGQLETGELAGGGKLPGAKEFSERIGVSLAVVQSSFSSLVRDGILESIPRSGTFVRNDWQERILPGSFVSFREFWPKLIGEFRETIPGIQPLHSFQKGMFEVRTTLDVQQNRDEYLDLAELFDAEYPEKACFFEAPFKNFRTDEGKLFGIPIIFSPRVLCYNPELLARLGCPEPYPGWSFDEFLGCIRHLRKSLEPNRIFNWSNCSFFWMNFIFRAGGSIIDNGRVMIDDPRTLEGILRVRALFEALGVRELKAGWDYAKRFNEGRCAFMLAAREEVDFNAPCRWKNAPLPLIPGGADLTAQATDLFCVRRHNGDIELARKMVRVLLSEAFQNRLGELRYGIPIRKTSAINSFDSSDPRDLLYLSEMTKISAGYNVDSPEICNLISNGIGEILYCGADPAAVVAELGTVLRTVLRLRHFPINQTGRTPDDGKEIFYIDRVTGGNRHHHHPRSNAAPGPQPGA